MMTLHQTAAAFIQQAEGDGLAFDSFAPVVVSGDEDVIAKYAAIIAHLRSKAAAHPSKPDFDRAVAVVAETLLGPQERQLRSRVGAPGSMVWLNAAPFHFGRVEAVLPGIALVTVHPDPLLPEDAIESWKARTENALAFHVGLVELEHVDQAVSNGVSQVLGIKPRPTIHRTTKREAS